MTCSPQGCAQSRETEDFRAVAPQQEDFYSPPPSGNKPENIPDILKGDYEIVYKFDVQSFLEYYRGIFTPAALERIVLRALRRRTEERYQTADEVQVALEGFAREQGLRLRRRGTRPGLVRSLDDEGDHRAGKEEEQQSEPIGRTPDDEVPHRLDPEIVDNKHREHGGQRDLYDHFAGGFCAEIQCGLRNLQ